MNTNIKTTNVNVTPTIGEHIDRHVAKISGFFNNDHSVKCDIELSRTTRHHNKGDIFKAEIHIVGHKQNIFKTAERSDLLVALDEVFDSVIYSMISRRKKVIHLARRGGAKVKSMVRGFWPWGNKNSLK